MKKLLSSVVMFSCASSVFANELLKGNFDVKIVDVKAYHITGAPESDINHNQKCAQEYDWIVGTEGKLSYKITPENYQYASLQMLDSVSSLHPMGIHGTYAFLSQQGVSDELKRNNIRQIYANLGKDLSSVKVHLSFENKEFFDQEFQCIAVSE